MFRDCYVTALSRDPMAQGTVVVRFVIAPDGTTREPCLVDTSLADIPALQCILENYAELVFIEAPGKTTVVYPILFTPD